MKKINSLLGLGYTAIPNNINLINTDSGGGFTRAKGIGLKSLFLFFLMPLLFWASPTNTWGDYITVDGVEYTLDDADNTARITGYTSVLQDKVTIPETIISYRNYKTYTITSIGDYVFYCCSRLTSIEIPTSVTSIGDEAFSDCYNLTTVTFAEGSQLKTIGDRAFYQCSSLTTIEIPASLTSIGDYAFYYCSSLTRIEIPAGVTSIGKGAFCYCCSLTSIEIPAGVTSIGDWAFSDCDSLTSVTFAEGSQLKTIGDYAFQCCNLTSIEISASVTSIGEDAFCHCKSLEKVVFLGDQPKASSIFFETPKLSCVYFIKGKKGWKDGAYWCNKLTQGVGDDPEPEIPEIRGEIQDGKLILTFTGTLESSEDGKEWISIDASSPYTVEMVGQGMLFRAVSK